MDNICKVLPDIIDIFALYVFFKYVFIYIYIFLYNNSHALSIIWKYWYFIFLLRAILNKSWRQHPTKHQLYGHLPPITKTIQVRRTRYAGHCWRSRDELISDVLLWTPTYGRAKARRPAQTYIQQLCEDTGCSPEDLPEAMNNREKWRERVRDIPASGTTWWWWWWWIITLSLFIDLIYIVLQPIK